MADIQTQLPVKITDNVNTVAITGASALKIDGSAVVQPVSDNGGSLTVDGTVAVQNGNTADYDTGAGTVTQVMFGIALPASGGPVAGGTATNPIRFDPTGTTAQPVTDNGGSLSVDDGGGSITVDGTVTANQGTAAAGSSAWPVAITDTADTVVKAGDSANNAIRVNIVAGSAGGASQTDRTAFTEASSTFAPVGGAFNDTLGADLTEDQAGVVRMTAKRAFHVNLRNSSATEIGTASNPIRVDPTGTTTQPVSMVEVSSGIVNFASSVGSVANASTGTITYTVTVGTTFYLKGIIAAASGGPCKVVVDYGSGPTLVATVFFSSAQPWVQLNFPQPISIPASTAVNVKITNNAGSAQDVYATIMGHEV